MVDYTAHAHLDQPVTKHTQLSTTTRGLVAVYPQLLVDIEIALDGCDGRLHVGIIFDAPLDGL